MTPPIKQTRRYDEAYVRRAAFAVEVLLQGKWRIQILCALGAGPIRLGQLSRLVPGASKKMLTQNLRKLEGDGIVVRKDMSEVVMHVEYALAQETSDVIKSFLDQLAEWTDLYLNRKSRH